MSKQHTHPHIPQNELERKAGLIDAGMDLRQKFQTLKENKDKAEISSPAELQFWQEQAAKAPAILRQASTEAVEQSKNAMRGYAIGGVTVGALLSAVNFSERFSRTNKIIATIAGAGAAATGLFLHFTQSSYANKMGDAVKQVADAIEKDPQIRQELVNELQKRVDGDNIARGYRTFDEEVQHAVHDYAMDKLGIGRMTMTNFAWKPVEPKQIGAGSWEELVKKDPQAVGQAPAR